MSAKAPSLAQIIVRSTVWTSLGTYANTFIGFGANLILARLLPVEVYGYVAMGSFWTAQLDLRPKAGLNYAAVQHPTLDEGLLGTYFSLDLALAALSLALSGLAAGVLAWLGYPPPVILSVLVLMLANSGVPALTGALAMAMEKELQVSRATLVTLVVSTVAYCVAIALALTGGGVWSLLAINSVMGLLGLGGMYLVCRQRLPQVFSRRWRFSRHLARELLRRGLPTGLALTAVLTFVTMYDNFLVGTFAGYDTLGFYDRAYRTAQWPNILLSTVISRIGFLTFSKVSDDPPRLLHAVRLALWVLLTLGIPIGLFLAFGAPEIITLLYGSRWLPSAAYLRYIAIFALAIPVASLGFWLAVAIKDTRTSLWLTITQAITLLVVATPLTWRLGVTGTLIGVGAATAVALILSTRYLFQRVPLAPGATLGPPLAAATAAGAGLWLVTHLQAFAGLADLARLASVALVGTGLFFAVLVGLRPAEFAERLRYLGQAWRRA